MSFENIVMLTEKQRLFNAIAREPCDRPPCICPGGMMNMAIRDLMEYNQAFFPHAHTDANKMAGLARAAYEAKCFENYGVPFCMTIEAEEMGAAVDLGDDKREPRVKEYAIGSVCEWHRLKPVSLEDGRAGTVLNAIRILKENNEGIPIIGNITGPVSVASSVLEPTDFYKELKKKNKEAHEFMKFVTEQLVVFAKAQLASGADIITISDPGGTGEILSPKLFFEFMVRYLNILTDALKADYPNAPVIVHICGRMHKVYDLLNQLKCDTLSFDACVSVKKAKELLPGHSIMGNVSTYALEYGKPEKISRITRKCIRDGVDVIAPACGLGNASPLVNMQAILKSVHETYNYACN